MQQILHLTKPLDTSFKQGFCIDQALMPRGEELSVLLKLSSPLCLVFAVHMQFNLPSKKRLFPSRRVKWKVPTGNYHEVAPS